MVKDYVITGDLQHWGIKGMHWGVRRYQNRDGSLTAAGKRRIAAKGRKASEDNAAPRPKTISELSDAELREKIARLRLEQDYINLTRNIQQQSTKNSNSAVKKFIGEAGKKIILDSTVNVASKAVQAALTKAVNDHTDLKLPTGEKDGKKDK